VFAHEGAVSYAWQPLMNLMSQSPADYGGNPALKLPILETPDGAWFGALQICRELVRRATAPVRAVWPEDLTDRTAANAQELVLQGMMTEVALIMRGLPAHDQEAASPADVKARASLMSTLSWLDQQLPAALRTLPADRTVSFLEVSSYCFIRHLDFRGVADTRGYLNLQAFCEVYGARPSLRDTEYRFDS
jgi:glutathione S-transferase